MINLNDLPPQIVPAVEAFASRLSQHVRDHREAPLEVHEQGVLDAWHAESGAVLAGVVSAATTGADPRARPPRSACPRCGRGGQPCAGVRGALRLGWARRAVLHAHALPLQALPTELE